MTLNVLFSAPSHRWHIYQRPLEVAFASAGVTVNLSGDHAPNSVDYIVFAPNGPVDDFSAYSRLKAVLGLWAGVETVVSNPTLTVPMSRMVDTGLRDGMVEWVTGNVLRYHLGLDPYICTQDGSWNPVIPPLARDRRVTILGLGELGSACASALARLNFQVSGWARRARGIEGVTCLQGSDGLNHALSRAEILVLLLPNTPVTTNILNASALAKMPKGARIINPGRGPLIDDDALLASLNTGHIAHATLDVFRVEPLPKDHAYWAHPNVTVTPHLAAETRPDSASQIIAENIRRFEAGQPLKFLVDRGAGY